MGTIFQIFYFRKHYLLTELAYLSEEIESRKNIQNPSTDPIEALSKMRIQSVQ